MYSVGTEYIYCTCEVLHVEIGDSIGVFGFSRSGRVYGVLVMVRGRAHIFGACRRGFFWRFGFPIFNPVPGYFDSVFGLRTKIGEISFLLEGGMKDETIKLRFGNHGICCNLFVSRHSLYSCNLIAMDRQIFLRLIEKILRFFRKVQWKMLVSISLTTKNNTRWLVVRLGKFSILLGNKQ